MKTYEKGRNAFIILALFIIGCDKSDPNPTKPNLDITYSESPFDLQGVNAKFAKDIAYDDKERTQFDIWLPNSNTATGLVIYVHGGGFSSGDKVELGISHLTSRFCLKIILLLLRFATRY
jgi:acetyl esterase/lipase